MSNKLWINRDFVLSDGMRVGEALDHPGYLHEPDWCTFPGETLQEVMEDRNFSYAEFAIRCGLSLRIVRGVVKGEMAITEKIAQGLAKGTGVSSDFWLNRERNYQETKARLEAQEASRGVPASPTWFRVAAAGG